MGCKFVAPKFAGLKSSLYIYTNNNTHNIMTHTTIGVDYAIPKPFKVQDKRIRVTLIFGGDLDKDGARAAKRETIRRISRKYGGCTVIDSRGYWSQNGDQFDIAYTGVASEPGFVLTVSVTEYDPKVIKRACLPMKAVGCKWIHCEIEPVYAKHFQI